MEVTINLDDLENKVNRMVKEAVALELSNETERTPRRHREKWAAWEERGLKRKLDTFLKKEAKILLRKPSAIAHRLQDYTLDEILLEYYRQ